MNSIRIRFRMFGLGALVLIGLVMVPDVSAQEDDTKAMLTQFNAKLRQAEKDVFAGELDRAVGSLEAINQLLAKAVAADPNSSGVKSAEKKYAALVKDLERRTGKSLGGGTATTTGPGDQPVPPEKTPAPGRVAGETPAVPAGDAKKPAAASAKIPYAARKPLTDATQRLDALERNLGDLADPAYAGDKNQLVKRADEKLDEIRGLLGEAKKLAAEKGVTSHPDIERAETGLAVAEKKVATAKGVHEKNKEELAGKSKEVDADVASLKAEYDRALPTFEAANGAVPHYNDLKPVGELIGRIEAFENKELPEVTQKMQDFARKYGSARDEIDKKAESSGYSGRQRASFPYTTLAAGIDNVRKTRTAMAEDLVKRAADQLARIGDTHDFHLAEELEQIKTWFAMAARYQADNPKVKQAQVGMDQQVAQAMKDFNARIDKRTWPGQASTAPSNGKQLSREALDWFKNSPDWGKKAGTPSIPLDVVVTGPWSVQQKNLLGEPTMYGLPVLLAVQVEGDKELNVARVFSLTMRTAERVGVKMEPPFDHVAVGDSYFIRPAAVK